MNPHRIPHSDPCPVGHTTHQACFCGDCPQWCHNGDKMTYTHYKAMVERSESTERAVVLESQFEDCDVASTR